LGAPPAPDATSAITAPAAFALVKIALTMSLKIPMGLLLPVDRRLPPLLPGK
jgi:hypothetical protein